MVVPYRGPEPGRDPRDEREAGNHECECGEQECHVAASFAPRREKAAQRNAEAVEREGREHGEADESHEYEPVDAQSSADVDRLRMDGVGIAADGLHVDRAVRADVEPPDVVANGEIPPVQRARRSSRHGHGAGADRSRRDAEIEAEPLEPGDRQRNTDRIAARVRGDRHGPLRRKNRVRRVRVENLAGDGRGRPEADGNNDLARKPCPVAGSEEGGGQERKKDNGTNA